MANFYRRSEETTCKEAAKLHVLKLFLLEELKVELPHRDVLKKLDVFLERIVEVDIQLLQWRNDCGSRLRPPVSVSASVSAPCRTTVLSCGSLVLHPFHLSEGVVPMNLASARRSGTDTERDTRRLEGCCLYCG